jgi:hypothetical protein
MTRFREYPTRNEALEQAVALARRWNTAVTVYQRLHENELARYYVVATAGFDIRIYYGPVVPLETFYPPLREEAP